MDELDLGNTIKGFIPGQKVLNRYKLERILGRGGMGVVWLARDEELERDIALKFLPEIVALDPEAVADLKRETRRNLDLTHPHIVRIHDFVSDKRTAAIAMEYVDGSTLAALKLERPGRVFTVGELRPWVEQFLEALHYAHTKAKVVHRDLKPANLMITGAGDLKVTDFGIAHSITDSVSRVSKQAGSSGTPVYMSPQQMMGEKTAVTDDIYAVGATLYELLTSKPPFYSGNIVMQVQNKEAPPIAERRAELGIEAEPVPPEWEEAIAACLAKDPAARPQSASELSERLELTTKRTKSTKQWTEDKKVERGPAVAGTRSEPVQRPGSTPDQSKIENQKSRMPVLAGLAAGALLLGGLGWYFGFYVPEQNRLAEMTQQKAWERAASGAGEEMGTQAKKDDPPAAAKTLPQFGQRLVVPDLSLEMIPIAPGSFQMGSASGGESDESPVTRVTLTKPFWLGKTEVTQAQWSAVMGGNPSHFKGEALPVEQVSWDEAMEFCRRLTERERAAGRLPEGHAYTLPTEAQWEYACRAGTTGDHAGNLDDMGWYISNTGGSTKPVGRNQANAWGLHDMHGNVSEWCADWKGDYPGGSVTDPIGILSGDLRVFRGGYWGDNADNCRSAYRLCAEPDFGGAGLGFRLALAPVPKALVATQTVASKPQSGQPWENSLGQKFVPVPGADVLFCIWETREQDYAAFVGATGHAWQSANAGSTHPVVNVSWEDAKAFCAWLTEKERREGRLGLDQSYCLPTDAEWSMAVGLREGVGSPKTKNAAINGEYPWGAIWPPSLQAGNYAPSLNVDNFERTAPVGSFAANRFGLHDLGGNVWEWCEDFYEGNSGGRVLRGASFLLSYTNRLLSSSRTLYSPRIRGDDIGFRVVVAVGSGAPTGGRGTDDATGSRTDASPGNSPQPSEEFKAWVANLRIIGVAAGQPTRLLVSGATYTSGAVINPALGIVFVGYEAESKLLTFKDASGAVLTRKL